ncbi:MAG: ANTAR domain-containing response regulator [Paracoccus sp. (in: a-proteobacteria)]
MKNTPLSITIISHSPDRGNAISSVLPGGYHKIIISPADSPGQYNRDLILIEASHIPHHQLKDLIHRIDPTRRPVAIFIGQSDQALTRYMIKSGVAAYVTGKHLHGNIADIIDIALARFEMIHDMRHEIAAAHTALEDRKLIDRAKGIVMNTRDISENDAYALMRRRAMEKGLRIVEIARAIVTSAEVLK